MEQMEMNRLEWEEFPFEGAFYEIGVVDEEASLLEQEEVEREILRTKCDILQHTTYDGAVFTTGYDIWVPMIETTGTNAASGISDSPVGGSYEDIPVRRGMTFRGTMWGYQVDGIVKSVGASQLGMYVVQIDDMTE